MEKISQQPAVPVETWEFPLENGCVVVRSDIPRLFWLNTMAHVIWSAYRQTNAEPATVAILAQTFDISQELAAHDVRETLTNWNSNGLQGPSQNVQPLR